MSDTHLSDVSFTQLHLPEALARGIADAGFERAGDVDYAQSWLVSRPDGA